MTLQASIGASDVSLQVSSASGLPTLFPFTLIVDLNQGVEEVVEVTAAAGTTLTVTRGVDGTTGFPHSSGAVIVHGISARDADEANLHINSTAAVHGVSGALVGTTDAQTLTNKTLSSATINSSTLSSPAISGGTIGGTTIRDTTILQGNPANSQNPASIRTVAGVEVGLVGRDGRLQVPKLEATSVDTAVTPLVVTGVASQAASLATIKTSGGTYGVDVNASGRVGIGRTAGVSTTALVRSVDVADPALRVQNLAGQVGNPLSVVDDLGTTTLFGVTPAGYLEGIHQPTTWENITLAGNRSIFDRTPQRRASGNPARGRKVYLQGSIKKTDNTPFVEGDLLFTMPGGWIPPNLKRYVGGATLAGAGTTGVCRIEIATNGQVTVWTQDSPTWVSIDGWYFLD